MFLILALSIGAPPSDLELEKAKAAVAVALAVEKLNHASPTDRFTATDGTVYEMCPDGVYRAVGKAPEVAAPKGNTFPSASGCGCVPGHNCGASFCKSHGGPGCPQSCPVKGVGK